MFHQLSHQGWILALVLPLAIGCSSSTPDAPTVDDSGAAGSDAGNGDTGTGDGSLPGKDGGADGATGPDAGEGGAAGSEGGADSAAEAATATLTISPLTSHVAPGGATLALTATLTHSNDPISWSLSPSALGSLSPATGAQVTFTSAATGAGQLATVTATAGSLTAQAAITVDPPLSDGGPPLPAQGFVTLDRVVDFAVLGADPNGSLSAGQPNNLFAIDPYKAYGLFNSTSVSPGADKLYLAARSTIFGASATKVGHAANIDDDFQEEVVTLTWVQHASVLSDAIAKVTILDPDGFDSNDSPILNTVSPAIVDENGTTMSLDVDPGCATPASWEDPGCYTAYDYDLALADTDGDGKAEVIITGTVATSYYNNAGAKTKHGKLWVFDYLPASNQLKLQRAMQLNGVTNNHGAMIARVAAGSMKSDRSVQIVVAWFDAVRWNTAWNGTGNAHNQYGIRQFSYAIFKATDLTQIGGNELTDATVPIQSQLAWETTTNNLLGMTLADVDGDGLKELVIGAWNTYNDVGSTGYQSRMALEIHDDLEAAALQGGDLAALPELSASVTDPEIRLGYNYPTRWLIALSELGTPSTPPDAGGGAGSGSKTEQLIAGNNLATYDWTVVNPADRIAWNQGLTPHSGVNYSYNNPIYTLFDPPVYYDTNNPAAWITDVQAGDVNGDGRDDVIALLDNGEVRVYGWICQDANVPCDQLAWTNFYTFTGSGPSAANAILVPAVFDHDSLSVTYAGSAQHSLIYKSNKVIALLAAPPVMDCVNQNCNNTATEYATGTTVTTTTESTFGLKAGVTAGFDAEISTGVVVEEKVAEVRAALSFNFEQTFGFDATSEQTITTEYLGAPGEDTVVFSSTPYDRYAYLVESSSNPALIGHTMYLDVPQPTQVMAVTRDYFNHVVSAGGMQITKALLKDTPYDLSTYPAASDVPAASTVSSVVDVGLSTPLNSTIDMWGKVGPFLVNEGSSTQAVTIDTSQTSGASSQQTFALDYSVEITLGEVLAGFDVGFSVGEYHSLAVSHTLTFGGAVGGMPDPYFSANQYHWGMYGYKQTLTDSSNAAFQSFFVVNYWVAP